MPPFQPKQHQTLTTNFFWNKIQSMVTKCIFTNITIPNPHKGKVVGYKTIKNVKKNLPWD